MKSKQIHILPMSGASVGQRLPLLCRQTDKLSETIRDIRFFSQNICYNEWKNTDLGLAWFFYLNYVENSRSATFYRLTYI